MPINPDAIGAKTAPQTFEWTDRVTLLYALGVGAGTADLALTARRDCAQRGVEAHVEFVTVDRAGDARAPVATRSRDAAVGWYQSPDYQRIPPLRVDDSSSMTAIVEGVPPGHTGAERVEELLR